MVLKTSPWILSSDWLNDNLEQEKIRIVDASWYLPNQDRDAKAEYLQEHIPGAVFFDLEAICDKNSSLPHMVPQPELFEQEVSKLGISTWDTVVIYDSVGYFSAPRVWWLFRLMGHRKVFILNGGFKDWKEKSYPISSGEEAVKEVTFKSNFNKDLVVSLEEMKEIVSSQAAQILDARNALRFAGKQPEPRENLKSGHMKGAINLPFDIFSDNGFLKPLDELKKILENANIDLDNPIVTTCGSGVTAAMIVFVLASLGIEGAKLYDGSWCEWGALDDVEIVTDK